MQRQSAKSLNLAIQAKTGGVEARRRSQITRVISGPSPSQSQRPHCQRVHVAASTSHWTTQTPHDPSIIHRTCLYVGVSVSVCLSLSVGSRNQVRDLRNFGSRGFDNSHPMQCAGIVVLPVRLLPSCLGTGVPSKTMLTRRVQWFRGRLGPVGPRTENRLGGFRRVAFACIRFRFTLLIGPRRCGRMTAKRAGGSFKLLDHVFPFFSLSCAGGFMRRQKKPSMLGTELPKKLPVTRVTRLMQGVADSGL